MRNLAPADPPRPEMAKEKIISLREWVNTCNHESAMHIIRSRKK